LLGPKFGKSGTMNAMEETLASPPHRWRRLVLSLGSVGIVVLGASRLVMRCEVEGVSMAPALAPGDRVVFRRRFGSGSLRVGTIVAFEDPRGATSQLMIKRVARSDKEEVDVLGDNAGASTDSRNFGPLRAADVKWIFVRRYASAWDRFAS
jgi:signal peptidase I